MTDDPLTHDIICRAKDMTEFITRGTDLQAKLREAGKRKVRQSVET